MELREAAGGDPNLFNAEKLQKKIKRKMLANLRNKKKRAAVQEQKSNDVFSFLNKSIAGILSLYFIYVIISSELRSVKKNSLFFIR